MLLSVKVGIAASRVGAAAFVFRVLFSSSPSTPRSSRLSSSRLSPLPPCDCSSPSDLVLYLFPPMSSPFCFAGGAGGTGPLRSEGLKDSKCDHFRGGCQNTRNENEAINTPRPSRTIAGTSIDEVTRVRADCIDFDKISWQ